MVDWDLIDTVLVDMDGTVLDLHFDSRFWCDHVPRAYARRHGIAADAGWGALQPRLQRVEGTLSWYCLDYWSRELDLDILTLKHELAHLIRFRPGAREFLTRLRQRDTPVLLVTNAHSDSLALKLERTDLRSLLQATVCSHDVGHPKESVDFWRRLQDLHPFDPARTLLVDDSLAVLRAARRFGIVHLLAVSLPDTEAPRCDTADFPALESFDDIMPE